MAGRLKGDTDASFFGEWQKLYKNSKHRSNENKAEPLLARPCFRYSCVYTNISAEQLWEVWRNLSIDTSILKEQYLLYFYNGRLSQVFFVGKIHKRPLLRA
jgi:hypothetical protein